MGGTLFGLFRDEATAQRVHAQLLEHGIAPDAVISHRQNEPVGAREENPGHVHPRDQSSVLGGLFTSLFDNAGEMDDSSSTHGFRQALQRGDYAVSVRTGSDEELAMATALFTEQGAVLQVQPDA